MNIDNQTYRQAEGLSRSDLWSLNKSPLHFRYALNHKQEPTPALTFGSAAHKLILEPEDFDNEYVVMPDVNRRTKEGKAIYQEFLEYANGKEVITSSDMSVISQMASAIKAHPVASELVKGLHEQSFFWTDDVTGIKCKCRPDCLTEYKGKKYVVDYKTTQSCEDGAFERSCRKYGYKLQAGMYTEGMFQNEFEEYGFAFVAQEKAEPYAVRVYFCSPEFIAEGYDKFRELLGLYKQCNDTGNWYGYDDSELLGDIEPEE